MSGFSFLMFTLALALSMQAIKISCAASSESTLGSSTSAIAKASSVTSRNAASTVAPFKSSQDAKTGASVASTSVAVNSSQHTPTGSAASTSVALKSPQNSASRSASQDATTGASAASTSVVVKSPQNSITSSVVSASVAVPHTMTIVGVASTSAWSNSTTTLNEAEQTSSVPMLSLTSSMSSNYSSANSNASLTGFASSHPTPGISSSVQVNKPSQSSTQVSPNASSFTPSTNTMKSLSSAAVTTAFTSQLVTTFSAPSRTSMTRMLSSSDGTLPSRSVSHFTQVGTSALAQPFSKETVSVMTPLAGSLTVSISNSSSTSSPLINTTSAVSTAAPSTSRPSTPTLPPEGTKFVSMEVSFDIPFEEEYRDTSSPEYKELKDNLTASLEKIYKNVDGFVGVRILFITEGSVVCSYIVIVAKDSKVTESELEEELQKASDAGEVFKVNSIKFAEDDSEETEEKLPKWALVVMIVLGCLSAVFLVTVIYVCVKYRRSLYGNSEAYLVSSGEIGLVHTYDTVSIDDNKTPANKVNAQKPAAERRVIGSHTNPTYGSNGALAD